MGHTTLPQSGDGREGVVNGESWLCTWEVVRVHKPSLPAVVLGISSDSILLRFPLSYSNLILELYSPHRP